MGNNLRALCGVCVALIAGAALAQSLPAPALPLTGGEVIQCVQPPPGTSGAGYKGCTAAEIAASATAPTGTALPHAANNAALSALAHTAYSAVVRDGFAARGDAPPLTYAPSASACSLNAGAGDGGSQVPTSDGGCWIANLPASPDVRDWGATAAGVSDSTAAISNALAAMAGASLTVPAGTFLASAFNIPANTQVLGAGQGITTIKRLSSATRNDTSVLVQTASGVDFENATIDLNSPGYAATTASYNSMSGIGPALGASTTGIAIRHVTIKNSGFYGLSFNDSGGTTHVGAQVDDVTITGAAWVGAVLRGVQNGSATRLNISSTGYDGVELENANNFVLSHFRVDRSASPPVLPLELNNSTTSSSSNPITPGAATFNVASCANSSPGQALYAYSTSAPTNYLYGTVTSCSGTTLIMNATATGGGGTPATWTMVAETGMLIWRGVGNQNLIITDGVANDNRHSGVFGDGIGIGENGTKSNDSVTPGTGPKTFTITGTCAANFGPIGYGYEVTAFSRAAPLTKWMRGTVTSCTGTSLVTNMAQATGGSASDWTINSESGNEIISDVTVSFAGLFGIDMASNTKLSHAFIDSAAQRGLNFGYDLGGRLSGASANDVRVRNVVSGPGVFFGDGLQFQSFENISLSHIIVFDDQSTKTTTFGVQVNATAATQTYSNVTLDNSNSYYSQVLTAAYNEFGTDSVRLDGSLAAFATTATWTGGTPTGYTFGGGACPGSTCVFHWDDHGSGKTRYINIQIAEGTVSGTAALSISLPFTINAIEGCSISGIDATNNTNVLGYAPAGGASMNIVPSAFTTAHGLALAGTCQVQ